MSTTTTDNKTGMTELKIAIPTKLMESLKEVALLQNSTLQDTVTSYLEEGVHQAMPKLRRTQYFNHLRQVLKDHNVPKETINTLEDNFNF